MAVRWFGLDELEANLRELATDLAMQSDPLVRDAAESAATLMRAGYPVRSGELRDSVVVNNVTRDRGPHYRVTNTSDHAGVFETGSMARSTALGATRGSMPAGNVQIPTAQKQRRRMRRAIKDLLVAFGAVVTGDE